MRWHAEPWRKLYVGKSPAWLRLPVSARGLGFLLLTYCDEHGRIDIGDDAPGVAVAYLLGARPKEHKRIADDISALLADGYLVLDGRTVTIRNFAEAQDRTPAAKRTAEWRARKDEANKVKTSPGDASGAVTGDVTCDARETSPGDAGETSPARRVRDDDLDPSRSESSRRDPPNPPAGGEVLELLPTEPGADPLVRRVWTAYCAAYDEAYGGGSGRLTLGKGRESLIRRRADEHGEPALVAAAQGVFRDPWCVQNRKTEPEWVWRNAANIEKYALACAEGVGEDDELAPPTDEMRAKAAAAFGGLSG